MKSKSNLFPPLTIYGLALLVLGLSMVPVTADDSTFTDANWSSMGGIPGVNGQVSAVVVDGSGNLYIGGDFTLVGDVFANGVAKWNGSVWTALGSGMDSGVSALAVSGSDLYAAGNYTETADGVATIIAKWNGSVWTALGSGMNNSVSALAVSGSDLYAGGRFTMAGGSAAKSIAKWDGSNWSALGSGMGGIFFGVSALALSGSDLYAGGYFTSAGGIAANRIAKWNGSSWSALDPGMDRGVSALAVSGSDLYVGGYFTTAGGIAANRIAKWNGSSWSALGPGIDNRAGQVYALVVSGSDVFVGGDFTTVGRGAANYIAKWNGSNWSWLSSGMNGSVSALAVSGSTVYAVGAGIAKWNGSGWSALSPGMNSWVNALAVSGSAMYAGGDFTTVGGIAANRIAKWNGSSWTALNSGLSGQVFALAVSGNDVYAGGNFRGAGDSVVNHIAKWNGSSWAPLGSGLGGGGTYGTYVFALAVSGSDLYAGGHFTNAGGIAANYIAKWDGSNWSALGSGMSGGLPPMPFDSLRVSVLAVSGNDLYAGGIFTNAGGSTANYVAKWNGSSWSALGSGMDGPVGTLTVSGSNVYAGGRFTTAGGNTANNIAQWNGNSWSPLGSGIGDIDPNNSPYVSEVAVSGSDLYAGGYFTTAGGSAANSIAKWNGSSWSRLGSGIGGDVRNGLNPSVPALAVSGNDLYAGGHFITAGGKVSASIARAYLPNLPVLSVRRSVLDLMLSWPSADTRDFTLEQSTALSAPASWIANTAIVTDDGGKKSVNFPATNRTQFFRLRRP